MKKLFVVFSLFVSLTLSASVVINMEQESGVYKVPCVVNGLRMKFILDTGAASVCISETMANFMLDNGYLSESDIVGVGKSTVADGRIVEHTNVILHTIEIGGKLITDVSAVIIKGQSSPLLLGQTALAKIGKVSISGNNLIIEETDGTQSNDVSILHTKACSAWNRDDFQMAAAYFEQYYYSIRNTDSQRNLDKTCEDIGDCYWELKAWDKVIDWYSKFADKYADAEVNDIALDYMRIGLCYYNLNTGRENTAIKFFNRAIYQYEHRSNVDFVQIALAYSNKCLCYARVGDYENAYYESVFAVDNYFKGRYHSLYEKYQQSGGKYIYTFLSKQNILDTDFGLIIYRNALMFTMYRNDLHCQAIEVASKMGCYEASKDYNEYCRQFGW